MATTKLASDLESNLWDTVEWDSGWQRLSLDINISVKYVFAGKAHTIFVFKDTIRIASHWNHVLQVWWKSGCASVAWNMSFYHKDKDFRLCKYRTLKPSENQVVRV